MTERSSADAALRDRLCRVEESIARACADAGRARDEVTLLAVTKTVPIDDILAAIRLGVRHVGENRVQEYMEKRPALPAGVRTQLIGHLQSNKVRRIVGEVDQIVGRYAAAGAEDLGRVGGAGHRDRCPRRGEHRR